MDAFKVPNGAVSGYVCAIVLMLGSSHASATHVGEELQVDQEAVASGDQLLGALSQYERAAPDQRTFLLQRLTQLATARRQRMLSLVDRNPSLAALRVMPQAIRERLPSAARALIERPVAVAGLVVATIGDDFVNARSTKRFEVIDAAGQRFELRVADASERDMLALVGKRGTITAMQLDRHLLVLDKRTLRLAADSQNTTTTTATGGTAIQGDQSTLVVMLNFNDKAITCTASDLQSRLFGSSGSTMNVGYQQSSGNLVSFSGQVVGPYTINYSSGGTCDANAWASAANAAAIAAGYNPSSYKRVSYVTPSNPNCGWSGMATLGGTSPTPSWVQACSATGVFSHELGHNLKLHHAATPTSEYGDGSDAMGAAKLVQSNAANRVMAGWMSGGQVQDVTMSGSYSLASLETLGATSPQVLRLAKPDTAEYYYVSLRQALGIDSALSSGYLNTLSIHRSTGTLPAKTFLLANVAAGQTWSDSINGVQITNQGVGSSGATVGVGFGGTACVLQAPSLAVNPATQAAPGGTMLSYTLTLTNRNSAACPQSTFNLTQALPAGFGGSFGASSVVLAAGASANVAWNVASPSGSAEATYTLTATAGDATVSSDAVHAAYVVSTPPPATDSTAPAVIITSPANGATVSGRSTTIAAEATDNVGVASVQFYVDGKLMATDTRAPYSASWNLRKVGRGTHTVGVRAVDAAGNATDQSISVTVQ